MEINVLRSKLRFRYAQIVRLTLSVEKQFDGFLGSLTVD